MGSSNTAVQSVPPGVTVEHDQGDVEVRRGRVPEVVESIGPKPVELLQAAIENIEERLIRVPLKGRVGIDVLENFARFGQQVLVSQCRRSRCSPVWMPPARNGSRGTFHITLTRSDR